MRGRVCRVRPLLRREFLVFRGVCVKESGEDTSVAWLITKSSQAWTVLYCLLWWRHEKKRKKREWKCEIHPPKKKRKISENYKRKKNVLAASQEEIKDGGRITRLTFFFIAARGGGGVADTILHFCVQQRSLFGACPLAMVVRWCVASPVGTVLPGTISLLLKYAESLRNRRKMRGGGGGGGGF